MEGRLLLDVVVGQRAAVLELFAGKDEMLLIGGNAIFMPPFRLCDTCRRTSNDSPFLVLDLSLDIVDCVRRLDLEDDGLPGQGLDEDLHAAAQTEDQVKGGFFLDVVVRKGAAVF